MGKLPTSMKMMQTLRQAEDNLNKEEDGEIGGVWIVGNVEDVKEEVVTSENAHAHTVRRMRTPTAEGADPSTGQMKIDVMN